jgi:hypothetical protein
LIIILFCLQDFEGIISATYANNWGEYLVQVVGQKGAVAILGMLRVDSTCATASCLLSAQRVTYAISRGHVLPFSSFFCKLSERKMAVNAAWLVYFISVAITCAVIGSTVAFSAATATATIATNASYVFPIVARHGGPKDFCARQVEPGPILAAAGRRGERVHQLPVRGLVAAAAVPRDGADTELRPHLHRRHHDHQRRRLDLSPVGRHTLVQGTDQDHHGRRVQVCSGKDAGTSER